MQTQSSRAAVLAVAVMLSTSGLAAPFQKTVHPKAPNERQFYDPSPEDIAHARKVEAALAARLAKVKTLSVRATTRYSRRDTKDVTVTVADYTFRRPYFQETIEGAKGEKPKITRGNQTVPPSGFVPLVTFPWKPDSTRTWHSKYHGEPVTVLENYSVSSTYDIMHLYISDKTGWPIAYESDHGGGDWVFTTRYTKLRVTLTK